MTERPLTASEAAFRRWADGEGRLEILPASNDPGTTRLCHSVAEAAFAAGARWAQEAGGREEREN